MARSRTHRSVAGVALLLCLLAGHAATSYAVCDTLDGIVTGGEQCDDNNSNPADGCNDCVLGYADVLIVGSTTRILGPTDPDLPGPMDENMATALGLTSVTVTDAEMAALTTANFNAYKALVFGDPTCQGSPPAVLGATVGAWGPAIDGNVLVYGGDVNFHKKFDALKSFIKYVAGGTTGTTGLYVSLSCYGDATYPWLNTAFGSLANGFFTPGDGDHDDARITATHPALAGLTEAFLSNWNQATHNIFTTWPSTFQVLALMVDGPGIVTLPQVGTGTPVTGAPHILARGFGLTGGACGNGVLDAGEECDPADAATSAGCAVNCVLEACGNGQIDTGEECDDGNLINGDGCDDNCGAGTCGNGIVEVGEECDDGNNVGGDGCSATCTFQTCGNNVVDAGESCDDGNTDNGDGCDDSCQVECVDGKLPSGEPCGDGVCSACPGKSSGPCRHMKDNTCHAYYFGTTICPSGTAECKSKDCVVSEWGSWGECTVKCGGGTRTRTRTVVKHPTGSGLKCPALVDVESCNKDKCDTGKCDECAGKSSGPCRHDKDGTCHAYYFGTKICPSGTSECSKGDCVVSAWSPWTKCSAPCDGGTQTRTRTVVKPASGGAACPALSESGSCNTHKCDAVTGKCGACSGKSSGPCRHTKDNVCHEFYAGTSVCPAGTSKCVMCEACNDKTSGPCRHDNDNSCHAYLIGTTCPPGTSECKESSGGGGGGSSDVCTGCWPGTAGPCQSFKSVCYPYYKGTTECPAGTFECKKTGSVPPKPLVVFDVEVTGAFDAALFEDELAGAAGLDAGSVVVEVVTATDAGATVGFVVVGDDPLSAAAAVSTALETNQVSAGFTGMNKPAEVGVSSQAVAAQSGSGLSTMGVALVASAATVGVALVVAGTVVAVRRQRSQAMERQNSVVKINIKGGRKVKRMATREPSSRVSPVSTRAASPTSSGSHD